MNVFKYIIYVSLIFTSLYSFAGKRKKNDINSNLPEKTVVKKRRIDDFNVQNTHLRYLIDQGDVSSIEQFLSSPDIRKELLSESSDPSQHLLQAIRNGNDEIITCFLTLEVEKEFLGSKDEAALALIHAIEQGHVDAVKAVIHTGYLSHFILFENESLQAFRYAINHDMGEVVALFLESCHANDLLESVKGAAKIFEYAVEKNLYYTARAFLTSDLYSHFIPIDDEGLNRLEKAIREENSDLVELLLQTKASAQLIHDDEGHEEFDRALRVQLQRGDYEIFEILISYYPSFYFQFADDISVQMQAEYQLYVALANMIINGVRDILEGIGQANFSIAKTLDLYESYYRNAQWWHYNTSIDEFFQEMNGLKNEYQMEFEKTKKNSTYFYQRKRSDKIMKNLLYPHNSSLDAVSIPLMTQPKKLKVLCEIIQYLNKKKISSLQDKCLACFKEAVSRRGNYGVANPLFFESEETFTKNLNSFLQLPDNCLYKVAPGLREYAHNPREFLKFIFNNTTWH